MIKKVFKISKIAPARSLEHTMLKLVEEVGELSEEINIRTGFIPKPPGPDGILGEAVDVIQCALDIIWLSNPEITKEEIIETLDRKNKKWASKFKGK